MKIVQKCPTCNKSVETVQEAELIPGMWIRTYSCGHTVPVETVAGAAQDTLDITSIDGKKLFKFQLEGAQFAERSNIRCLIADEMGLGKTPQSLAVAKAHPECLPFVVFVKAGLRVQWNKEAVRWGDFVCQVLDNTREEMIPGFDGYIISLDSSWRYGVDKKGKPIPGKLTLPEQIKKCKVKLIIIDECQLIKNSASKRTKCVQDCCREVEHVMGLSGTPIKNNAAEYFPILNILRPDKFPKESTFVYGWCDSYFDGYRTRTGGIRDIRKFMDYTKDFIIRRDRATVLPDLPLIFRSFQFTELGELVEEEYKKTWKEFNDFYTDESSTISSFERASNILAYLSKMRHITGLAKIDPVCEYVEEFVTTTDRKLMIFVHHKDVGEILALKLREMSKEWSAEWGKEILQLTSDMDAYEREAVIDRFRSPDCRILIGSTLASGEGLNLQFCSDCIMMERQWNPANEEQAEARFPRPGSTADKINATYFVATGTVDEFFSELVEQKREICTKTMKGEAMKWDQSSLVSELSKALSERGGKKWGW